ncbi:probable phosphoserine aminotransferase [Penaeus monodon]|uniref:probable phosphoserine aminotransferase n=1 Tax=Penaeus monodon TaxID=6687 RepID=UPI0018A7B539|nr:probable phosphoserine aminotransferase [Penaeus monodon]
MTSSISYFSPGPAKLPHEILVKLQDELVQYKSTQVSVMELSHRSKDFAEIIEGAESSVRELMNVPSNYKVLFLQGGGTGQFAAVPLNLMSRTGKADYIVTGSWSSKAAKEASKYGSVNLVLPKLEKYTTIPGKSSWKLDPEAAYVYYCANETVEGTWNVSFPIKRPFNTLHSYFRHTFFWKAPFFHTLYTFLTPFQFGVIYGGAQKNIGCPGVTVVIVREDLLGSPLPVCPSVLDYAVMAKNKSLYNTPPTFAIHVVGEVLAWVKREGGLDEMQRRSLEKSKMLYSVIDESNGFYNNPVDAAARSRMNVVFRVGEGGKDDLEAKFISQAASQGLLSLKGHRSVGGIRASVYNAITIDDVRRLAEFMKTFLKENKV